MSEQIEIEYKILVNQDIFQSILNDYKHNITKDYIQTNYYFTHPLLEKKKYMLRIRKKENQYELTLKRPINNHRIETNISITNDEAKLFFEHRDINNEITEILKKEDICIKDLNQQFSLTTHRYDISFDEGMLSLDENHYLGCVDYEIEFEVSNEEVGFAKFLEIIQPYHLNYTQNCKSKIKRVLDSF